jgi:hypothetical protein
LEVAVDIASISGLFVGIAGVWYSVKAWRRATAAEQAANEAREAVRRGNAADDLELLATLANELLECVEYEQLQAAAARGRDLISGISKARMRWRACFPSADVEKSLKEVGKGVEEISNLLSIRKGDITPTERENVLNFCHKALRILKGEAGRMANYIEGSASGR